MFFMHIQRLPFLFLFAYMRFVLFARAKSFCKKIKKFKTALMTSLTLLLETWKCVWWQSIKSITYCSNIKWACTMLKIPPAPPKELLTQHHQLLPGYLLQLPTISIANIPMHQISHKPPHMTMDPLRYQLTHLTNIKRKKKLCIYKVGLQMYNTLRSIYS